MNNIDLNIAPPVFSIITVCLNAGDSLLDTIGSVLMQKFTDYNLIIKDGGSLDKSFDSIQDDIRIIKIQRNDNGIYDAMNQALEKATGQYVIFLNSGDLFYSNSVLGSFYDAIIYNNFPGLIYCDYTTTGLGEYVQSPNKLTNFFLFRTMLCHQVCVVKRNYYNSVGYFDTSLHVEGDYDFLLRLIILNKVRHIHIQMLGIISASGGFSFQNSELAKSEVRLIRKKYFSNTYFVYNFLLALTLPTLRQKILNRNNLVSKIYQRLVNSFNRIF